MGVVLERKSGGNIRVNILHLTRGYGALGGSWLGKEIISKFRVNIYEQMGFPD